VGRSVCAASVPVARLAVAWGGIKILAPGRMFRGARFSGEHDEQHGKRCNWFRATNGGGRLVAGRQPVEHA
jgi:hypothetical protein